VHFDALQQLNVSVVNVPVLRGCYNDILRIIHTSFSSPTWRAALAAVLFEDFYAVQGAIFMDEM